MCYIKLMLHTVICIISIVWYTLLYAYILVAAVPLVRCSPCSGLATLLPQLESKELNTVLLCKILRAFCELEPLAAIRAACCCMALINRSNLPLVSLAGAFLCIVAVELRSLGSWAITVTSLLRGAHSVQRAAE